MKRSALRICACLLAIAAPLAGTAPAAAAATQPPSAKQFYESALAAMRNLPEPAYVDDTLRGRGQGIAINLEVIRHLVWLGFTLGSGRSVWTMQHRTDDYATAIVDEHGRRYLSQRSFFDPTWYGTYRALRDGMLDYQDREKPIAPRAIPTPDPSGLKTIAILSVMGPGIYHVRDAGPATCSNGDAGHALHLIARDHDPRHQLSGVVVDLRNMRLCSVRFALGAAFGFAGYVEQHYADVGGYWMQTGGVIDGNLRLFGIAVHHGVWRYRLTGMNFPQRIASKTFAVPAGQ